MSNLVIKTRCIAKTVRERLKPYGDGTIYSTTICLRVLQGASHSDIELNVAQEDGEQFEVGKEYSMPFFSIDKIVELKETIRKYGVTTDELIEMEATFGFDTALGLMEEGYKLKRQSDERVLTLTYVDIRMGPNSEKGIAHVDDEGKVLSFVQLTTEQLLAKDYVIVK